MRKRYSQSLHVNYYEFYKVTMSLLNECGQKRISEKPGCLFLSENKVSTHTLQSLSLFVICCTFPCQGTPNPI